MTTKYLDFHVYYRSAECYMYVKKIYVVCFEVSSVYT